MRRVLAAPLAELLELDLALHFLLVLPRVVIDALAGLAEQLDDIFREFRFCHTDSILYERGVTTQTVQSWSRRGGLNSRPTPYHGVALPLSYGGTALLEAKRVFDLLRHVADLPLGLHEIIGDLVFDHAAHGALVRRDVGEKDHRHGFAPDIFAEALQHRHAVHLRQNDVEKHEVGMFLEREREALLAIQRGDNIKAMCNKLIREHAKKRLLVLNNKNALLKIHAESIAQPLAGFLCAQGRIRTCVAHRALDLQSSAFDRSATCARAYSLYLI